jgi:hypothetical protein
LTCSSAARCADGRAAANLAASRAAQVQSDTLGTEGPA